VLLSYMLIGRKSLQSLVGLLYLPFALAIVSLVIADNFETVRTGEFVRDMQMVPRSEGMLSFAHRERYMHVLSRFSYCFVNVAAKMYLFKEAAF